MLKKSEKKNWQDNINYRFKLGQILFRQKLLTRQELDTALVHHKNSGLRLGESLLQLGYISEKTLYRALSGSLQRPYMSLHQYLKEDKKPDQEALRLCSPGFAQRHLMAPLRIKKFPQGNKLVVITSDPQNYEALKELEFSAGMTLFEMISCPSEIQEFIECYYPSSTSAFQSNSKPEAFYDYLMQDEPVFDFENQEIEPEEDLIHRDAELENMTEELEQFDDSRTTAFDFQVEHPKVVNISAMRTRRMKR